MNNNIMYTAAACMTKHEPACMIIIILKMSANWVRINFVHDIVW